MLLQIIVTIALSLSVSMYTMDTEQDTKKVESLKREQSNNNKIQFMRKTFTEKRTWDFILAQEEPLLSLRKATSIHSMSLQPIPSSEVTQQLLDYTIKKRIQFSIPLILYKGNTKTCIGCEDTSIHVLAEEYNKPLKHMYLPPCHNHRITSIASISPSWIAIAGGNAITFCNIYNLERKVRVTFNPSFIFTAINEEFGILVCQTKSNDQFIMYPYDTKLYNLLHGKELSEYELEVMFLAAHALHKKQELNFTQAETALYKNLPKQLTALVDYFFLNQQSQNF